MADQKSQRVERGVLSARYTLEVVVREVREQSEAPGDVFDLLADDLEAARLSIIRSWDTFSRQRDGTPNVAERIVEEIIDTITDNCTCEGPCPVHDHYPPIPGKRPPPPEDGNESYLKALLAKMIAEERREYDERMSQLGKGEAPSPVSGRKATLREVKACPQCNNRWYIPEWTGPGSMVSKEMKPCPTCANTKD